MHHYLKWDKKSEIRFAVLVDAFQLWSPPWVRGGDNSGELIGAAFTGLPQVKLP
jgi:hypothetical protein